MVQISRRSMLSTGAIVAGSLVVMVAALAAARISGLDLEAAVSDPQEVTDSRFLGIVSTVGILVWGSTVSVCLFGFIAAGGVAEAGRLRRFLVASGVVALVLLIDDLLLVHEFADDVVARFVDFDRTRRQKDFLESVVFAGYAMMFAVYLAVFRDRLRAAKDLHLLVASLLLFALSTAIDIDVLGALGISMPSDDLEIFAEEAAKFVAIALYAAFYFSLVRQSLGLGTSEPDGDR